MDTYDEKEDSSYIVYVDCNNLYGYSMMQHLPIRGFKWCEEEFDTEKILNIADDADMGFMFEVDLGYPEKLHDLHNDYPFCAENKLVPNTQRVKKLLLTLSDKKKLCNSLPNVEIGTSTWSSSKKSSPCHTV